MSDEFADATRHDLRPAFSRRRTFLWFLAATAAFAIREGLNGEAVAVPVGTEIAEGVRFNNNDRRPIYDRTLSFLDGLELGRKFVVLNGTTKCMFMTTDTELGALEILKLYSLRFKIDAEKLAANPPRGLTTYLLPPGDPRRIEDEE